MNFRYGVGKHASTHGPGRLHHYDPTNPLVAWATYMTFNSGTNVGHVFKLTVNATTGAITSTSMDRTGDGVSDQTEIGDWTFVGQFSLKSLQPRLLLPHL